MSVNSYRIVSVAAIIAILLVLATMSLSRDYFTFGTETDYVGAFIQEAARFQQGEALELFYHPPAYSITLGLIQNVTDDWFVTGRFVSLGAAAIVLVTSLVFYALALSRAAAIGVLVVMVASPLFLTYGALASSDLFFFALYTSSLTLAFLAARKRSMLTWVGAGIVIGMALLSRTNGISLLLILLVPWLEPVERTGSRLRATMAVSLGLALPIAAWLAYASATGSPLMPVNTHINLAWTFFPPDGVDAWRDAIDYARQKFPNVWAVFTHDPAGMIRQYAIGLYKLPARLAEAGDVLAYPLNLLYLPAVLFLLITARDRWVVIAVVLALGQVLLMGLNIYLPRYYLFLLPLIGAAMGHASGQIFFGPGMASGGTIGRVIAGFVVSGLAVLAILNSFFDAQRYLTTSGAELRESIPEVTQLIPAGSVVVARKPVVAFYTESQASGMPAGQSLEDLRSHLQAVGAEVGNREVFVYFGAAERAHRPEYSDLGLSYQAIEWLELEATGEQPEAWYLFRFRRTASALD